MGVFVKINKLFLKFIQKYKVLIEIKIFIRKDIRMIAFFLIVIKIVQISVGLDKFGRLLD